MRGSQLETIARDAIAVAAGLPLAAALACAGAAHEGDAASAASVLASPAAPDAVRIQLVFGADVDLDLYVTGPAEEAGTSANGTLLHHGGRLVADQRCSSPAPRVETIEFARAAAGRYRVGVDFMIRCAHGIDRAPFEQIAEAPGQPPIRRHGEATFGAFDPRVLEFEVGAPPR